MEPKQICFDEPPSARYQSCISQCLRSYNRGEINNVLRGRRIRACFHGWVILSNHPDSVLWSLWNPLTSKLIRLPPLIRKEGDSHACCLSSPPDEQGSVFLLLTVGIPTIVFCRLDCKKKKLKWIEMSYARQLKSISGVDCVLECPTWCNGKVYAMTMDLNYTFIVHVDIAVRDEDVVISLLPFVEVPHTSRISVYAIYSFLKGSHTELFYIEVYFKDDNETRIGEVHLFKLDMTSIKWEEMEDLKHAMFLLQFGNTIFYKSPAPLETAGYVYILDNNEKIISFHVKDRTMSLSSKGIERESQVLAWVMLECSLEAVHPESKQAQEDKDNEIVARPVNGVFDRAICESHLLRLEADHPESKQAQEDKANEIVARPVNAVFDRAIGKSHLIRLEADHRESKQAQEDKDNKVVARPVTAEFDSTIGESHLLRIPFYVLEMIMGLCVCVEYMNFRATCKRCHLAAPSIQWNHKTTSRRLETYFLASPWLMVLNNCRSLITFIDPIFGERYFIKTPQELDDDYQVYCSNSGWLLMYKVNGPVVLYNPFTSDIRTLPELPFVESFCLSASPSSPDCMVVGFSRRHWHVYILLVSQETLWRRFRLDFGSNLPYSFHSPTFSGRDIYALCNDGNIAVFRGMGEEHFSWEVTKDKAPKSCSESSTEYFLSKCDEHFYLVTVGEFGESVEVFKLNISTKEWEKIDGLGKHMIYISDASCICLEAKLPEMENKIYFPRTLHNEDNKIVFYSLETCRYHTFDGKNIQESFGDNLLKTKHYCDPHIWIEPSWSKYSPH